MGSDNFSKINKIVDLQNFLLCHSFLTKNRLFLLKDFSKLLWCALRTCSATAIVFTFRSVKYTIHFTRYAYIYSWNNASTILNRFFPLSLSILKKKMSNHDIDNYKIFNMDGPYRKSLIAINKKEKYFHWQF